MSPYRLTPLAAADIGNILDETLRLFGSLQEERYYDLLLAAVERIAADPFSIGTKACDSLSTGLRSFHVGTAASRQGAASHVLYFRPVTSLDGKREILIARVLHDRMDPERHIAASD
jgi:plasmid stabilization system protein ParE